MSDEKTAQHGQDGRLNQEQSVELIVKVPEDLYRAYQRCCWIVNNETGRCRNELASEMVTDFLIKNGC